MGRCFLCDPPSDMDDDQFAAHMRVEHDLDVYEAAEKWPDGEVVIYDETLEPENFNG